MKKQIKLLAEKFNHKIDYEKYIILLKNECNEIRIWQDDKYGTNISYNSNINSFKKLKLKTEDFYNVLIEILRRKNQENELTIATGILLTVEEWIKEEGKFAEKQIEKLKKDIKHKSIEYRNLGGNRFLAEYFKGILILTDDLYWAKSNVVSIK